MTTPMSKHSQRQAILRRRVQNSLAIPKIDGSSSAVSNYSPQSRHTGLREMADSPLKVAGTNLSIGAGLILESPKSRGEVVGGASFFQIGVEDALDDEFHETYEELEKLGEGGASVVYKIRCK